MYVWKNCGCVLKELYPPTALEKGLLDRFVPRTIQSKMWKYWRAILDSKLCVNCLQHHGKIYAMEEIPEIEPPLHENCRCVILPMEAIIPGGATQDGENGADYWLASYGTLPKYYISKQNMYHLKWKEGRDPRKYAPGKMIFGGVYHNKDGHLPSKTGRIWYEADINYYEGRRNKHRILFSNDGLLFVTYDHYRTFYEIISGGVKCE